MSGEQIPGSDLSPSEAQVARLTQQGFIVPNPGIPVLHPDGRIAVVYNDGTYDVWYQIADALRSAGRPSRLPQRHDIDGNVE